MVLEICGRWEIGLTNRGVVEDWWNMANGLPKMIGGGSLRPLYNVPN